MDALIVILLALALCLKNSVEPEIEEVIEERETRLNPTFYVDEHAFMEVADAILNCGSGGADS